MPDVFISYSRRDKSFVEELVKRLEAEGRDVWVDFEDIPFASEWWEEICEGIEGSQATVFVISPDSLDSKVCGLEVNYTAKNKKRLIPILYRQPGQDVTIAQDVSHLNWIYFNTPEIFDESFRKLLETMDTDLVTQRRRTRLLMKAKDWEKKGHSNSLLLRGDELEELQPMLKQADITDLQRDFLNRSLKRERRVKMFQQFGWGFLGGFLGIGFWAFSVFPTENNMLITPLRLIYTIALGEVFGLFIGMLSILAEDTLTYTRRILPEKLILPFRIIGTLVISFAAWAVFGWFYTQNPVLGQSDINSILFGGVGLAAGFLLRILFKMPGWLSTLLTAVLTYIPVYVTFNDYWSGGSTFQPLIYVSYDAPSQIYTIGIPIVILIALGANARRLLQEGQKLYRRLFADRNQNVSTPLAADAASGST